MTCELVKSLMTPSQGFTTHYVGVFQGEPSTIPDPVYIEDTSRFVWNFLADRTELNRKEWKKFPAQNEECTDACKNPEEVCVASTADHKGRCIVSTTRYVPAFSPRLGYESSGWQLLPLETGDTMGAADPVYTESFWSTIGLQVYLQESSWFDEVVLFLGVSITAFSFFAIISTKAVFQKRLKRA
jgi:nicastrin